MTTTDCPAVVQQSHPSLATQLVELVTSSEAELWHDPTSQQPYITVSIGDHREHYRLNSRAARDWLARLGHLELGRAPGGQAVTDATTVLSGIARYDGAAYPVGVRLAAFGDSLVLDLGDPNWRAVVITPDGWHVEETSPVRFRRPRGMLALPEPVPGGSLDPLRELLHITSDTTWTQLVGWQIGTFAPHGPYPVEMLLGEQGSGKTLLGRFQRGLIDPHMTPLRGPVRDERDLMIAASHTHVVAFDNLSRIPDWLSDGLCRIATGGGFATRALYSDDEEHMIDVTKPVMVTAISAVISRGDLLDRATVISLPTIPESRRRPEATLIAEYEALRPSLLGAELDLVAAALAERSNVTASVLPRMADHVLWVMAAEKALGWPVGTYTKAYSQQQQDAVEVQLEGDPFVQALRQLMAERDVWEGTATALLETLAQHVPDALKRPDAGWPRSSKGLSGKLDRLAPDLRRTGLDVSRYHNGKERIVSVRNVKRVSRPADTGSTTNESTSGSEHSLTDSLGPQASESGVSNEPNASNESGQLLPGFRDSYGDGIF